MGQACMKSCLQNRTFKPLRLFGPRQAPFHRLYDEDELHLQFYSSDYPFLFDQEIGRWLVFTKFMIILRGPPGSGKSTLANFIKSRFPTTQICSADEYRCTNESNFEALRFDFEHMEEANRKCEDFAKLCASRGISPLVIDNTNMRSYECRPYTDIARLFDYNVIFVTPKTPWRFDVKSLAEKNVHCLSADMISPMLAQFEPTVKPLYYGWCFAGSPSCNVKSEISEEATTGIFPSMITSGMIQHFYDTFLSVLDIPRVRDRFASAWGLDLNRIHLVDHWSSAIHPSFGCKTESVRPNRPHCTAFFSQFGQADGAIEYEGRKSVSKALLGVIHDLYIEGLFVTSRTVGLRVGLKDSNTLSLWGGLDNESMDRVPHLPRPPGSRAHVTLALATGVSAVETGFDVLRIIDAERVNRPDLARIDMPYGVLREILVSVSTDLQIPDHIFYYQYCPPKIARLMYTAFY